MKKVRSREEIVKKIDGLIETIIQADPIKMPPPKLVNLYLVCAAQIKALRWTIEVPEET